MTPMSEELIIEYSRWQRERVAEIRARFAREQDGSYIDGTVLRHTAGFRRVYDASGH